jgi:transcriptional regulator with XRE-family HTH domain
LGELLQKHRQRRGLTQFQVAEASDLSLKYLGEVERGEANVTVDALERIARVVECDPWEVFSTERPPISECVHRLLLSELLGASTRMRALADWVQKLDPATGPSANDEGADGLEKPTATPPEVTSWPW